MLGRVESLRLTSLRSFVQERMVVSLGWSSTRTSGGHLKNRLLTWNLCPSHVCVYHFHLPLPLIWRFLNELMKNRANVIRKIRRFWRKKTPNLELIKKKWVRWEKWNFCLISDFGLNFFPVCNNARPGLTNDDFILNILVFHHHSYQFSANVTNKEQIQH